MPSISKTVQAISKAHEAVLACVEHAYRKGELVREALECEGLLYRYGSSRLPMGAAPALRTIGPIDPTTKLLIDRITDPDYAYPTDMYGGFVCKG